MVAHKAPEHTPAAIAEPGLIMRLSQNLGSANDVFQLEGFADRDASQTEIDHLADKMVRAASRLKAKADLPNLRRSLENVEHKHGENRKRMAALDAGEREDTVIRNEKIGELKVKEQQLYAAAQEAHYASGRKGEFKPHGAGGAEVGKIRSDIAKIEEGAVSVRNEAAVQRSTLENELKEGERAILQLKTLLGETERLARGEDISGV